MLGLAALGHDVWYHEDTWCWPYDPVRNTVTGDAGYSVDYLARFFAGYAPDLLGHWHYVHLHDRSYGISRASFDEIARTADVFLDVGGACMIPDALRPSCAKVMIDTDPGYNQIVLSELPEWSENAERWRRSVESHDQHFTYAENIRSPDCLVPRLGLDWRPTRPPVVLDPWRDLALSPPPAGAPWTTIMTWNPFKGRLVYAGREYRGKAPEFEKIIDLPASVAAPLRIAVGGTAAPRERLAAHGWQVVDGPETTLTPRLYRDFIRGSKGELSCAKEVYVALRTGWFSERTACYLAAGRPAIVQDTGFAGSLPVGEGLLAFDDAAGARAAIERVEADYPRHARAALGIARDVFAAEKVLARLLDGITHPH
jgi:hypothetical protein